MPQDALKLAHKYIGRKPMPASLKTPLSGMGWCSCCLAFISVQRS